MGGWRRLDRLAQVRALSKLRLPPPEVDGVGKGLVGGVWAAAAAVPDVQGDDWK